jgi:hypothetical protein
MEPRHWRPGTPHTPIEQCHRFTIARRIVLAAGLALFCVAVTAVSVAAFEIASDWMHSGRDVS